MARVIICLLMLAVNGCSAGMTNEQIVALLKQHDALLGRHEEFHRVTMKSLGEVRNTIGLNKETK